MQGPEQVEVVTGNGDLYVARSAIHGRGVFAARAFAPGELVERAPVLVCPAPQESLLEETDLWGFYFSWDDESDEDDGVAVALGFGSLYNHAWHASCRYEHDVELEVVDFYTVRAIVTGEELTVNYTGDPDGTGELWFSTDDPPSSS